MRVVRMIAALITVIGVALVGGCGSESGPRSGGAGITAPTDPKEQLVVGVRALNSTTFRMVENITTTLLSSREEGVADPVRRAVRLTQSVSGGGRTVGTDTVVLGTDLYMRSDLPDLPGMPAGQWVHIDATRVKSPRAVGADADDISGNLAMVAAITAIERTAPRELRGTFDPSKVAGGLPGAAGQARSVSWQARIDEQNRLVWLLRTTPADGTTSATTIETAYSGFGEPVTVERPPAGSTVEAPAGVYTILGR